MFSFAYKDWTQPHHTVWEKILEENKLLETEDHIVIEIGCFEGRSTVWFADRLIKTPHSRYICIDNWEGGEEFKRLGLNYDMELARKNFFHNIRLLKSFDRISVNHLNSERALSYLHPIHYRKAHFIYVDGSHTQRDTLVDLVLSLSLLKKDGILIVDDYKNNMGTANKTLRATEAVDFIIRSMSNELEAKETEQGQMLIKRIQ